LSRFTDALTVREFDVDHGIWELREPLVWEVGHEGSGVEIRVPTGFCTDGASIPWPLSIVMNRWGRWRRAACLHDYMLEQIKGETPHPNAPTRKDADREFYEALLASGVWRVTAFVFWAAVRAWGMTKG
jgi:hypothetical protein